MAASKTSGGDVFDIISYRPDTAVVGDYEKAMSAPMIDPDTSMQAAFRKAYPEMTVTATPLSNGSILDFATQGNASVELDTKTDTAIRWRAFVVPHRGQPGQLGDSIFFAKYNIHWGQDDFILYIAGPPVAKMQYVLKEPGPGEHHNSNCAKSDALVKAAALAAGAESDEFVFVFDLMWRQSKELWQEVQKSSWDKVILDPKMKGSLQEISNTFFDSKELYENYGVPWKRGLIFAGPPGNGKTISVKALMHTLYSRKPPIPTLYVKYAPETWYLAAVFQKARQMTPCMLIMEDIETIVTPKTRSYFFNEVDGLASNGGLLMVASTNYLDRLDPGLSKRPSRFDRKFIFPRPNEEERTLYAEFWRSKLEKAKSDIRFPTKLCPAMAQITDGFSFAYMQEAFISTLLEIARDSTDEEELEQLLADSQDLAAHFQNKRDDGGGDDDLRGYKLWRVFKVQVTNLRKNMGDDGNGGEESAVQDQALQPPSVYPDLTQRPALRQSNLELSPSVTTDGIESHLSISSNKSGEPSPAEVAAAGFTKRPYQQIGVFEWHI